MILTIVIDRFENDKAVLKTTDNETIVWPKSKLPVGVTEGSVLAFAIVNDKLKGEENLKLAKDILNEILNPNDADTK
jgi:hypothetical protein